MTRGFRAVRRLVIALFVVLAASMVVFAALPLSGGDAARARLGSAASPADVAALDARLGLDRPLPYRYWTWLSHALHGNLGTSYLTDAPVTQLIGQRIAPTAVLILVSLVIAIPSSAAIGLWVGLRGSRPDGRLAGAGTLLAVAVPEFVLAAVLVTVFAVGLGWLPAVSTLPPGSSVLSRPERLVLPVVTLVVTSVGYLARLIATGVAAADASDAVENARLNGIGEARVRRTWILPAAARTAVPATARTISYVIGASLIVETVFGLPGLAKLLVDATNSQDVPVVLGVTVLLALVTVLLNLLADSVVDAMTPAAGGHHGDTPRPAHTDDPVPA